MPESSFTITLKAYEDDVSPARIAKIHGYPADFVKSVKEVQKKAEFPWGWCTVMLSAEYRVNDEAIQVSSQTLSGSSYLNAADFVVNSDYFDDMLKTAIAGLKATLLAAGLAPTPDELRKISGAPPA